MEDYRNTKLYKAIDETLHYIWDPIGVYDVPQARDEYYTYSAHIYKMVCENATEKDIAEYLYKIEKEYMGLDPKTQGCAGAAEIIMDWNEHLKK